MDGEDFVLKLSEISKSYGKKKVLDNLSMTIKRGDIYGFIGKNGAGKTTTIRIITGLAKPNSGKVELFNGERLSSARGRIGTVIESPAFYPHMTAFENMETLRIFLGIKDKQVSGEILNIVGLSGTDKVKAKNFSLGMKERLAIGLSLLSDPEFLVLDEPTNGLDPTGIREIRELILTLNRERNVTVLISSHILGELTKIATCYGVIANGSIVAEVQAQEISEKFKSCIKLMVNDTKKACEILTESLGINNCEIKNDDVIYIYEQLDNWNDINSELIKNDIIIREITREMRDPEEYFINLMEGKRND